ncbi:16S rRNA (cytidine1402-2'-O)-methyltransferase [Tenacibaculum skagerrakense]|uniref:16S rRNA (Cytidine1402-2'-O)-methyltransferase n=1 Tax=Tenacibaculum skagerrakense TaxID=186571 RepID=A0A4R2NVN2_9FLAO|nr:SAM-dependent methyltransferase [Tenacibaculum skagerrakense]TCP25648.1 16S rRNA (cytidine1402-2'-O)-methyltransferase [Tenacibaculum skagerrakense]
MLGKLYLIPTTLGDTEPLEVMPISVKKVIESLDYFIVENEKTARRYIKRITPSKVQSELHFMKIDKFSHELETRNYLDVCQHGISVGVLSEAGVPGVADPGATIVKQAHEKGIQVIPLVGPSSILLAMMASGMNGQNFAFNGYLPIDKSDKKKVLKELEKVSRDKKQSQIFIETPYRNGKMLDDLRTTLQPNTRLCVACDITLPTEYIKTLPVSKWKSENPDLHKRPAIFIIQA